MEFSEKKLVPIEEVKVVEKPENQKQSGLFLSSYLYWPVKSTLETSAISDYIKNLKFEKPKVKQDLPKQV